MSRLRKYLSQITHTQTLIVFCRPVRGRNSTSVRVYKLVNSTYLLQKAVVPTISDESGSNIIMRTRAHTQRMCETETQTMTDNHKQTAQNSIRTSRTIQALADANSKNSAGGKLTPDQLPTTRGQRLPPHLKLPRPSGSLWQRIKDAKKTNRDIDDMNDKATAAATAHVHSMHWLQKHSHSEQQAHSILNSTYLKT